jgi:hypothetical protein
VQDHHHDADQPDRADWLCNGIKELALKEGISVGFALAPVFGGEPGTDKNKSLTRYELGI